MAKMQGFDFAFVAFVVGDHYPSPPPTISRFA